MIKPNFESDVPLPPYGRRGRKSRYIWLKELDIGQSFVCDKRNALVIMTCFRRVKYLPEGFTLASQSIDHSETRIWRVA